MAGGERGGRNGEPLAGAKGLADAVVELDGRVGLAQQGLKLGEAAFRLPQVVLRGRRARDLIVV